MRNLFSLLALFTLTSSPANTGDYRVDTDGSDCLESIDDRGRDLTECVTQTRVCEDDGWCLTSVVSLTATETRRCDAAGNCSVTVDSEEVNTDLYDNGWWASMTTVVQLRVTETPTDQSVREVFRFTTASTADDELDMLDDDATTAVVEVDTDTR